MPRTFGFLLALTSVSVPASAQALQPVPPAAASLPTLLHQDGQLWGVGDTYKVAFAHRGTTFVPRLGERAPHNAPLAFLAERCGRGEVGQPLPAVAPVVGERRVDYVRPGVTERWELRPDGAEFRFVFDTLPRGGGDLWVDVALRTDLLVEADGRGLRCAWPGIGGCTIGGVTGIDADGDQVAGALTYDGQRLRLSLPAAFVEQASLPLVIDPLVGGVFTIDNAANIQRETDAAHDVLSGNRLVVYHHLNSASDYDLYGVVVGPTGTVGARLPLVVGTAHDTGVQVANVLGVSRFVLAWHRNGDVLAMSVNTAGGGASAVVTVANTANTLSDVDIGGDQSALHNAALVVWRDGTGNRIEARSVLVNGSGVLTPSAQVIVDTASTTNPLERPRISKQTATGKHLVAWGRNPGGGANNTDVVARTLTWGSNGSTVALGSVLPLDTTNSDTDRPDLDGNGTQWAVVWQRPMTANDNDLYGIGVRAAGTTLTTGVVTIEADVAQNDFDPAVCCTGGSFLCTWMTRQVSGGAFGMEARGIDLFTCATCGPKVTIPEAAPQMQRPNACADGSSPYNNQALVVYDTVQDTKGVLWTADDGVQQHLEGGCGTSARHFTTCARVGHADFEVTLTEVTGAASASLVVSPATWNLPCNLCRLVPDPTAGALFLALPVSNGEATQAIAIPPDAVLAGLSFWSQWLVHPTSAPSCISLGSHFTHALQTTIQ